ncbi:MAG: sodium:proton antiporter [Brevibacterium sp.]|nr:sodium:proton antiporter [Brevibacterium sandarakinum]MDN5585300.1 sodium:proton antiporter [Brevibacterium sp.]MDN5656865.1 sodium:proton antiporter [Brevibacterium sandarakinum]
MGGAITYIGHGPNLRVKSLANSANLGMPSLGGCVGWPMTQLAAILAPANMRDGRSEARKRTGSTDRTSESGE